MPGEPNFCVVIPVFNHALTVGRVAREAKDYFPVIVVNDGSTDDTGRILAAEKGISVIALPRNQGKGAALRAGFAEAEKRGFTHAITIDADGQHATRELAALASASRMEPEALIIGVRDLVKEKAPRGRRVTNSLSTFWFKVETGVNLADTQCGYRGYPLKTVNRLRLKSGQSVERHGCDFVPALAAFHSEVLPPGAAAENLRLRPLASSAARQASGNGNAPAVYRARGHAGESGLRGRAGAFLRHRAHLGFSNDHRRRARA